MPELSTVEARARFEILKSSGSAERQQFRGSWWDKDEPSWYTKLRQHDHAVAYRPSRKASSHSETLMWKCRLTRKWYSSKPAGSVVSDGTHYEEGVYYLPSSQLVRHKFKQCHNCGKKVHEMNMFYRDSLCLRCLEVMHSKCASCDNYVKKEEAVTLGLQHYHDKCYYKQHTEHSYSYKPKRVAFKRGKRELMHRRLLYFGLELETTGRACEKWSESLRSIVDSGQFYIKHDGSVTDGAELVSFPMTREYMKENPKMLEEIFALSDSGWTCDESCGMHIHLSRASFTNHHAYKFQSFFMHNKDFLVGLSGRNNSDHLERYSSFSASARRCTTMDVAKGRLSHKYVACRATDFSYEIRIFQGTLQKESFLRNIELADSLYWYTRTASRIAITASSYKLWVVAHAKSYPNLATKFCDKIRDRQAKAKDYICAQ